MTRAITELVTLIQPGDCLTLLSGDVYESAGSPVNPAAYRRGQHWIVSVRTSWGRMPIDLYTVVRVERGGIVVWDKNGERVPVQMEMF
jgi:hypothetical protein